MKKIILLLLISNIIYAQDFFNSYFDFSQSFYDPNTGLTIFPLLEIPMGGKYEAMGTAFTSIANDSSFIDANPAGSSILSNSYLSLFHNDWIADTSIDSILYTERKDNLGYALGAKILYVPFTEYDDWGETNASIYYTETVLYTNISYNFFSDYYFNGIAAGLNVKMAHRNIPEVIEPGQSAMSILVDIGILSSFDFLRLYPATDDNFSVGANLKNLGFPVMGEAVPTIYSVGFSYRIIRPLLLSLDYNTPMNFIDADENPYVSTGLDLRFADFVSLQTGFYHKGGNPRFSMGVELVQSDTKINVNYTVGLENQFNRLDRFSIETSLNLGGRDGSKNRENAIKYYIQGLEFYSEGDMDKARKYMQTSLSFDERFTPAKEIINLITRSEQLRDELQEVNSLL